MNKKFVSIAAFVLVNLLLTHLQTTPKAQTKSGYQTPPPALAELVDQPISPEVLISADKKWVALLKRVGVQSIADLAQPEEKLAGLKINANIFGPSRTTGYSGIKLQSLDKGQSQILNSLPSGKITQVSFSPDSQKMAFIRETTDNLTLWVYFIAEDKIKPLDKVQINAAAGGSFYQWKPDSTGIYTRITTAKAADRPTSTIDNIEPVIQITDGKKSAVRTFSNLLRSQQDSLLFEFLTTSQLAELSLDGEVNPLGTPGIIYMYSPSPNGQYLLVSKYQKPFSYLVPASRFPKLTEVWDANGKLVKTIAELPSGENIPKGFDSAIVGRRQIGWRQDEPAVLYWAEAQDHGDMSEDVEFHDFIYTWKSPFSTSPEVLQKVTHRFYRIVWGHSNFAIAYSFRFKDRQLYAWKFNPSNPKEPTIEFQKRSYNDQYNDPGSLMMERNEYGKRVIKLIGPQKTVVYLSGLGASPEGNVPFLDKFDFQTQKKERIWHSTAPYYERVVSLLDKDTTQVLTLRESKTEPPNFFIRNLNSEKTVQLTHFPHPTPSFKDIKKEHVKYKRTDGTDLNGTLYLPPGYTKEQGRIPVLIWAYPLEYKDKEIAGQITESPYEFVRVSYQGPMPHLAHGFAVFDDPKMPIIGHGDELPNNTFREQLVESAEAAIQVLVDKGIADPKRIAIAGHSYGAFMVANLLAHSNLFRAGIARSGAYNRTLTPFGFQGEERSFWEGRDVYSDMSPFFYADKINQPLLMLHGEDDPNSGTYPMQSERMFAAIKGLGGEARLVMLPHEQHGYRARESLLHMLWEQYQWLETHVKPKLAP